VTRGRQELGARGEKAVADWYDERGYTLLAANWRCSAGEVDLVLESPGGGTVVFCEVKARTSDRFGTGFDAVTIAKQRRLRRLAARWLEEERSGDSGRRRWREVRFDVASVTVGRDGRISVEVLHAAF